jgi:hypothetical protein
LRPNWIGDKVTHALATIGPQYVLWTAESEADFDACATLLNSKSSHVSITDAGGFELLEARDLDDLPDTITFPGPDAIARERIISRTYHW